MIATPVPDYAVVKYLKCLEFEFVSAIRFFEPEFQLVYFDLMEKQLSSRLFALLHSDGVSTQKNIPKIKLEHLDRFGSTFCEEYKENTTNGATRGSIHHS